MELAGYELLLNASLLGGVAYLLAYWRRQHRFVKASARGIDPIGEAEVFLFSHNHKAAIRVLQAALQDEPHNVAIQVTLLRAFAEGGKAKEYRQLAAHLQPQLEQQAIWEQIRKTGQTLLPHDEFFR